MIPASSSRWGISILCSWTVLCALSTLAVILRLSSRRIKKTALATNDYAVILALFFAYCLFADALVLILGGGLGHHQQEVSADQTMVLLKAFPAGAILWACSNTAVKISILHLYACIFPIRQFRMAAYTTMAMTMAYVITIFLETLLICRPFAYFWDKSIHGTCGNEVITYLTAGIFNLLIDVTIVILPMPMLWGLQMPLAKKIALTGIFGIGAAICVFTMLRIKALHDLDLTDITYSIAPMGLWTLLEPTLGIINACLPVIQPALHKMSPSNVFSWTIFTTQRSHTGSGGHVVRGNGGDYPTKSFQRLDDHTYPLKDAYGNFNRIGKSERAAETGDQDMEQQPNINESQGSETLIYVERSWDVRESA